MRTILLIFLCFGLVVVAACSLAKKADNAKTPTSAESPAVGGGHNSDAPANNSTQPIASTVVATPQNSEIKDEVHTPEKGTEERQAIMDALRGNQNVIFQVNYLKIHNGWCWVDTTPLDTKGRATAEGGANLLHFENGRWRVMNLAKVPEDPDDPMGPDDPSPTYIRNLMKTFPGLPKDILPKASS